MFAPVTRHWFEVRDADAFTRSGDPPTPTVGPGSGNGWRLAGTFSSATVSSSVWYSGGIDNEAWKRVQAAGTASLTIADKPAGI